MILNCLLNLLRLNTDITLRGGCGTVLQESLDKGDVITVCLVDRYLCQDVEKRGKRGRFCGIQAERKLLPTGGSGGQECVFREFQIPG